MDSQVVIGLSIIALSCLYIIYLNNKISSSQKQEFNNIQKSINNITLLLSTQQKNQVELSRLMIKFDLNEVTKLQTDKKIDPEKYKFRKQIRRKNFRLTAI